MAQQQTRRSPSEVRPLRPVPHTGGAAPIDTDLVRRRELGGFLRSRRERIAPQEVGLPVGSRRRTPGLRREEIAQLAGVGVTWYTWLEQGRNINVSQQVLDAIARTLGLDPHERAHLFTLAGAPHRLDDADSSALSPAVQQILDQLDPFPACAQNARYDLLAYNRTYNELMVDLDDLPFEERNCLWLAFTHPGWRETMIDWEWATARMVAQYRAAMAEHVGEPAWKCLVKRLQAVSPRFAELWARHEVEAPQSRPKRFLHRDVGLLVFGYAHLWLGPHHGTRLTTYTPADDDTRERIRVLHARAASRASA